MRTEQEIKERLALFLESINSKSNITHNQCILFVIRELEWVLGVREK